MIEFQTKYLRSFLETYLVYLIVVEIELESKSNETGIENKFGRNYFAMYAWNIGEVDRCLGIPVNEADLLDSLNI